MSRKTSKYLMSRTKIIWRDKWIFSYLDKSMTNKYDREERIYTWGTDQSRGLGKLGHKGAICWMKKELSWRLGTLHIFLGTKLFFMIENWKFQHLFDFGFRETLQNFSSFRQIFRRHFSMGSLTELKVCEVSRNPK